MTNALVAIDAILVRHGGHSRTWYAATNEFLIRLLAP
jgi:hypothetical protein